ncbi:hypothetical protein BIFANG_02500 [Bifidobacterium angulatum DSM 20098 = JCM 7096]|uniref:Uncharacterized protein n=1 Tax=Bifidobacterium angulatum DSM 20098 = JCM 7096 TaxID=518635 RepID=C4FDW2_9BIFI|nr:hypothetical protein BIFANG_02500 [Bifidobacterium angulatum DSM 20098 = JCM 7096]
MLGKRKLPDASHYMDSRLSVYEDCLFARILVVFAMVVSA